MTWTAVRKRLQRQSFDLLTHQHGLIIIVMSIVVIFVTIVHFGESLATWSSEKYMAVVNSFSDNVIGQSFRARLCLPIPIDIVYTWVNGSDARLLNDLQMYKDTMLNDAASIQNNTDALMCKYDNCVFANGIVIEPPVPSTISLRHLGLLYPAFKNAKSLISNVDPVNHRNVSLIFFATEDVAETSLKQTVVIREKTANIRKLFYTTERGLPNTVQASAVAVMIGFPDELEHDQLIEAFPQEHRSQIVQLTVHKSRGIAVLTMSDTAACTALVHSTNISILGKSPTFKEASFVWDLTDYRRSEDISASRFEDNDELRYSLRSVEKHAPWVRHIFIVTNGQIPSWLNLDDERVTIVSHSEIFVNKSHLPTFSSPAIESHIHRIPGLSDWFIYMNDDVLFGRDVWPDDFVTASGTQKVYLTWPVPNCNDGCPASWISDGYCDRACNNSQCEWDGGDCEAGAGRSQYPMYGLHGGGNSAHLPRSNDLYCNQGCANNWIADRYCDQSCNVRACGFDAADCGTDNFNELRCVDLDNGLNHYDAKGTDIIYFNLSTLVGGESGSVLSGTFLQDGIIRSASVARKFQVVTVVLYHNETERTLNFSLSVKNAAGRNFTYNFTVSVDTFHLVERANGDVKEQTSHQVNATKGAETDLEASFIFTLNASRKFPQPKYQSQLHISLQEAIHLQNITEDDVPVAAKAEYKSMLEELKNNDLTQSGFNLMLNALMKRYAESMDNIHQIEPLLSEPRILYSDSSQHVQSSGMLRNRSRFFANSVKDKEGSHNYKMNKEVHGRRLNYLHDSEEMIDEDELKIFNTRQHYVLANEHAGFLPWEKFDKVSPVSSPIEKTENAYETDSRAGKRHLLDTYADSLRHVSRVYNRAYGYTARRVPAHMPHMMNRHIATSMQEKFSEEWDLTSSHRIRRPDDMQFAFSYFYFLMSEPLNSTIDELFSEIDIDASGALSDRELRILATRIYDLPIDLETIEGLERTIINCSKHNSTSVEFVGFTSSDWEVYYDQNMPQVTLELVKSCPVITQAFQKQLKSRTKYEFEVLGEDSVLFKMLNANVSRVVAILDEVRQNPRKFICLNDNIDYEQRSAKTVKAVLRDFYESFFPKPSRFELPAEYRNRFLHVDELHEWWRYRTWLQRFTMSCLFVAVAFAVVSFCSDRLYSMRRRWLRR